MLREALIGVSSCVPGMGRGLGEGTGGCISQSDPQDPPFAESLGEHRTKARGSMHEWQKVSMHQS